MTPLPTSSGIEKSLTKERTLTTNRGRRPPMTPLPTSSGIDVEKPNC